MSKTTSCYLEHILNQKRKFKYTGISRKHYDRYYKKMAEEVANYSLDSSIHYLKLRRFFLLPIKYRSYCKSLIKNKIKK